MFSANCNAFRFCCNALQGMGLKMKEIFVQQHGAKPHKVNDVPYFLNKHFHSTVLTNRYHKQFDGLVCTCTPYLQGTTTVVKDHSLNTIPSVLFIIMYEYPSILSNQDSSVAKKDTMVFRMSF
jgi:hypothetical protein